MSETKQKGSFVLFKSVRKEGDHPRKPVYTGSIELPDGTKFDLAGWINEGRAGSKIEGQKYIKGEVAEPWKPEAKASAPAAPQGPAMAEEDIPF